MSERIFPIATIVGLFTGVNLRDNQLDSTDLVKHITGRLDVNAVEEARKYLLDRYGGLFTGLKLTPVPEGATNEEIKSLALEDALEAKQSFRDISVGQLEQNVDTTRENPETSFQARLEHSRQAPPGTAPQGPGS